MFTNLTPKVSESIDSSCDSKQFHVIQDWNKMFTKAFYNSWKNRYNLTIFHPLRLLRLKSFRKYSQVKLSYLGEILFERVQNFIFCLFIARKYKGWSNVCNIHIETNLIMCSTPSRACCWDYSRRKFFQDLRVGSSEITSFSGQTVP